MSAKEEFLKVFLAGLTEILPNHGMLEAYTEYIGGLSDGAMEALVAAIEKEEFILPLIAPNLSPKKISTKRNLALARKWGHEFYQHIVITDPVDPSVTLETPEKYLVIDLMCRRNAQTLDDKMSIPKDISHVDDLSGQVTGDSKGSGISKPEAHVADFHGLDATLNELLKVRGGDNAALNAMIASIQETGHFSLDVTDEGNTRAKSAETLEAWLKVAHIGNNLTG